MINTSSLQAGYGNPESSPSKPAFFQAADTRPCLDILSESQGELIVPETKMHILRPLDVAEIIGNLGVAEAELRIDEFYESIGAIYITFTFAKTIPRGEGRTAEVRACANEDTNTTLDDRNKLRREILSFP